MALEYNPELYTLKAELCKTFADPKRLMIINKLGNGECTVGDLAVAICTPQAIVSRHLALLRDRGVVKPRREGNNIYYSVTDPQIIVVCNMMHQILLNQIEKNKELAERLTA